MHTTTESAASAPKTKWVYAIIINGGAPKERTRYCTPALTASKIRLILNQRTSGYTSTDEQADKEESTLQMAAFTVA